MSPVTRRAFVSGGVGLCAQAAAGPGRNAPLPLERTPAATPAVRRERRRILAAMAREDIPGAAVCLISSGRPAWIEGFGVTGHASDRRVGADTIFSIQSTSKHMTATAVMLAVQRGLLDLDEPIVTYLPAFSVHSRFEAAPERSITLRLLLSHRAGLTHEAPVGNNYDPASPDFEAHVRSIRDTWLRFPPGGRYRYSNLGFDLAGHILEVRSGMPFADCLKTMLFDPLGMSDTTADTEACAQRPDRALGHEKGHASVPLKTPLTASGGVYTSARDMGAYCLFHLNRGTLNGRTVLSEALWHEMHGFALGGDYGLGVIRSEVRHGATPLRLLGHRGGGFGFGSVFDYCPEAGLAWIAMFNRPVSAAYRFGRQLVIDELTQRYGPRRPRRPADSLAPIEPSQAWLGRLAGSYVGRNIHAQLQVGSGGTLTLQVGGSADTLHFTAPQDAYIVAADGETVTYEYHAGTGTEPAHLECSTGEDSLDYNDGPHDPPGPDRPQWSAFVGRYEIQQWGRVSDTVTVRRHNGYLYLDEVRLILELKPGLFFTSDGETVDFRDGGPAFRNIRLRRID